MKINLEKAKEIAHDRRRQVRAEKFAPLDIKATIPKESEQAEADRQVIRDADEELQLSIEAFTDVDSLIDLMREAGLV